MPKAGPSKPANGTVSSGGYKKPQKEIQKTADLLKRNAQAKAKGNGNGKGKEKEVLGSVMDLVENLKSLPGGIQVERFAEVRALEIMALQNAIKSAAAQASTRTFQSLPRHLRRRAASHNPKRVPKRFRERAAAEIQEHDNIARIQRKKAKLRAKGNLRGESRTEQLLKRQRTKTWLPTHVWHAKRFHMTNLWGYRLALTPTLKSFRPSYRAAKRKCIVHDSSYFGTIQLEGRRDDLMGVLEPVVVGKFAGTRYEMGSRMARALLYDGNAFPRGLIGPVEIIWRPPVEGTTERTLWLRLHPAIYDEVYHLLTHLITSRASFPTGAASGSTSQILNPVVRISNLTKELDSFELVGPTSGRILRRILRICRSEQADKVNFFQSLRAAEPGEIERDMIVGLLIHDSRLVFPAPASGTVVSSVDEDGVQRSSSTVQASSTLAQSTIWDQDVRDDLATPRYKMSDLDHRRHKLGLPGSRLKPTAHDDKIPLLLVQRSLSSEMHGFTVLLPRGWSQYFLTAFTYAGCRMAGLAERRVQHRESGVPCFPEHFGDTCLAGRNWESKAADESRVRWERKPPAKRVEWGSMSTRSPWQPDWGEIMSPAPTTLHSGDEEEISNSPETSKAISSPWLFPPLFSAYIPSLLASPQETLLTLLNAYRSQRNLPLIPSRTAEALFSTAVVHVTLEADGRGSPGDMAAVYSLSSMERDRWDDATNHDIKFGRTAWADQEGKSELQKLGEEAQEQRLIIGYTTTGNVSLARGKGFALATITLGGYLDMLRVAKGRRVLVLVKNRDSPLFRLARVELVTEL